MKPFAKPLQEAFDAFESGRFDEAEQRCRELLKTSASGELFFVLGLVANKTARQAESVQWLERAAEALPPSLRLLSALGGAYRAAGQRSRAAECYTRCLALKPDSAEAYQALADVCYELRQFELATLTYRRAAELAPTSAAAWNNLGNNLRNLGRVDEALAAYARARELAPNDPTIRANRGRTLLTGGQLAEGFQEHRFRWQNTSAASRIFSQPRWQGEPLLQQTLLVHAEQGLGDTIHFVRYLPRVRDRTGRVVLECQAALQSLLENSAGADAVVTARSNLPPFDVHVPLLDLPAVFHTTLETIPANVPYLTPPGRKHLPPSPANLLKAGLVWAGNQEFPDDAVRSIPLREFATLLKVPGVSFFSLQLSVPRHDGDFFQSAPLIPALADAKDFGDTADIVAGLDLIISVDTAVAHLAGALAKPVWTLLPSAADWRWMLHRADSPWYPTMKLFRQTTLGAWQPVIERVTAELIQRLPVALHGDGQHHQQK